ncbi:Uncharacterized protein SCF082_LOCUS17562 [Durusdinium trenchii]|uniref:Uncharacterized protein n=1 Tax=Durusdinium trenchii TaxID=1381693 RepID=A0ABP0KIQ4_9DINO
MAGAEGPKDDLMEFVDAPLKADLMVKGPWGKVWQHGVIYGMVLGSACLFMFLFSGMKYCKGDEVYLKLTEQYDFAWLAASTAFALTMVMYIADVRYWNGNWRFVGAALLLACLVGYCAAALLAVKEYIVAPLSLFLFGTPVIFLALKRLAFLRMDIVAYLSSLRNAQFIVFLVAFVSWTAWVVADDRYWNVELKIEYYLRMECNVTNTIVETYVFDGGRVDLDAFTDEEVVEIDNQLVSCTEAFILWLAPFILAVWSFIFSAVLFFLIRTLNHARAATDKAKAMDPLAQAFLMLVSLGVFGLWVASSIAGAEMELSNIILALSLMMFVLTAVVVVAVFGVSNIRESMNTTPLGNRLIAMMNSDWTRALLAMLTTPIFLCYLVLSFITQQARRFFGCTKPLSDEEKKNLLTTNALRMIRSARGWNWGSVLVKTLWVGVAFFIFSVGVTRITTLLLSVLNEVMEPLSLGPVTVLFVIIGLTGFALPPVPGIPVYVFAGILLVPPAEKAGFGFWPAAMYAVLVSFLLKMAAIVLQQKVFGEIMGSKRVSIRRAVGVNSVEIRAIRVILTKRGLAMGKVAILCGGPDWPTSVLAGLLRVPLFGLDGALIGSLPVIFLIAPVVVAGALLLRAPEGEFWATLSTMALAVAFLIQSAAMLGAVHFIAKTVVENEEELKKMPPDEEVLALEEVSQHKSKVRSAVNHWRNLDPVSRVMLFLASVTMTASCYLFQGFGSGCFEVFEVTDSVSTTLDGNALNLVKPLGWIGVALWGYGTVFLYVFSKYLTYLTNLALKDKDLEERLIARATGNNNELAAIH